MGPARHLPGAYQAPTRGLPGPYQGPTRGLSDPYQRPSRPLPVAYQAPTRGLPDPYQWPTRGLTRPPTRGLPQAYHKPTRSLPGAYQEPHRSRPHTIPTQPPACIKTHNGVLLSLGHNHASNQALRMCLRRVQLPMPTAEPQRPTMTKCRDFLLVFHYRTHQPFENTQCCRTCRF